MLEKNHDANERERESSEYNTIQSAIDWRMSIKSGVCAIPGDQISASAITEHHI